MGLLPMVNASKDRVAQIDADLEIFRYASDDI